MVPTGLGIGATQVACRVVSPTRATARPPIVTVGDPLAITPGPAGVQPGSMQGCVMSPTHATGMPPMVTVTAPGGMMANGRAGWGTGVGGTAGWIGAWQWGACCST